MKEIILNVKGMMCQGCENRVKNVLGEINGISNVTADHTTGKVSIMCNDENSIEEIAKTIEDIGYEIVKED